mmetsp:Transcript_17114/g.43411  ORF Transcript_17114/g.43411 Transcript_17114/m.43411 type:complete len:289 (-) Transcript_17114:54-920(-)
MAQSAFRPDAAAGRVVLVTGGGSGIGFGIARTLGEHGAKVVLMGRRQNFLDDACAKLAELGVQAAGVTGDVRMEEDAQRAVAFAVAKFGKLDTLVNSAAGNFLALAEEMSYNAFRTVMEIDAFGVFNMSRSAFSALKASGNGVVINISATLHFAATWYQTHATAAKSAIDTMTRQMALEWGYHNIRVNGIAPGPIADTPGFSKLIGAGGAQAQEEVRKGVPLGRLGTTTDIGNAALFLCSSAGSFVSGHLLVVDGAEWLWTPPPQPREVISQLSKKVEGKSRAMKAKL